MWFRKTRYRLCESLKINMDTLLTPYFDKPEIEFMGPGVRPSKAGLGSANAKKK
jgi:hypothetical protein